jgi:hypothetical protein
MAASARELRTKKLNGFRLATIETIKNGATSSSSPSSLQDVSG